MVHRLPITPVPEFARRPSVKHQTDACCSPSLRERVRVGGKYSVEHAKCSASRGLLTSAALLPPQIISWLCIGTAPPYSQILAPIPRVFSRCPFNRTATRGADVSFRYISGGLFRQFTITSRSPSSSRS